MNKTVKRILFLSLIVLFAGLVEGRGYCPGSNYFCACDPDCQGPYESTKDFNTIDNCLDGNDVSIYEYVEKMYIRAFNSTPFKGGDRVELYAQYLCYAGDPIAIAYSNFSNGAATIWRNIYNNVCGDYGLKEYYFNFTLDDNDGMHAFRWIISYPGATGLTCGQYIVDGAYTSSDTDDIDFYVLPKPDTVPPSVTYISPTSGQSFEKSQSLKVPITLTITDQNQIANISGLLVWPGSSVRFNLTHISGSIFAYNFTNLTSIARYNITITANDTLNNTGKTYTYFYIINNATLGINAPVFGSTISSLNSTLDISIYDSSKPYSSVYYILNSGSQVNLTSSQKINATYYLAEEYFSNELENLSQSFVPVRDLNLDYVSLRLKRNLSGQANVTLQIRSDNSNSPSSQIMAYGNAMSGQSQLQPGWLNFTLNATLAVLNNTRYWLYIEQNSTFIYWQASNETGYSNGTFKRNPEYDLVFEAYDRSRYIEPIQVLEDTNTIDACEINSVADLECSYVVFKADTIPPAHSEPTLTKPFELGDLYQFIRINLIDYSSAISKVTIEKNFTNTSAEFYSGNTYQYRWTITSVGTYFYRFYFNDSAGNKNQTILYNFSVVDTRSPNITSTKYAPNEARDLDPNITIFINASLIDDSLISKVYLQYMENGTAWQNKSMANISRTYFGNFTPDSESVWSFRIFAEDIYGNQRYSSQENLSVYYDLTWTRYPSALSDLYGTQGSDIHVGNITYNNSGDQEVTLSISKYSGVPILSFSESLITLSPGNTKQVNVTLIAPENNDAPYPVTVMTICNDNDCQPNNQTTTFSILVGEGGPFVSAFDVEFDPSVRQGDRNIVLNATFKNAGNETAMNVSVNWTIPQGWTTTHNTSIYFGNMTSFGVTPDQRFFGIVTSIGTGAPTGNINLTIVIEYYVNETEKVTNTVVRQVLVSELPTSAPAENTGTTSSNVEPPPGGGGGGGGGAPSGSSGGGPSISSQPIILNASYPEFVSILRGSSAEFDVSLKNVFENLIFTDITLELTGMTIDANVSPMIISALNVSETGIFNINVKVPAYYGPGKYPLVLKLDYIIKRSYSQNGSLATQELPVNLVITEVSSNESFACMMHSGELIDGMMQDGLNVDALNDFLNDAKIAFSQFDYNQVVDICTRIEKQSKEVYNLKASLDLLALRIKDYENQNYDLDRVNRLLEIAASAFREGNYDDARATMDDVESLLIAEINLENAKLFNSIGRFLQRFWWLVILLGMGAVAASLVGYNRYQTIKMVQKKNDLEKEQILIKQKEIELQTSYFKDKKISEVIYKELLTEHKRRAAEINQELAAISHTRINKISKTVDKAKQREDILNLVKGLQKSFFTLKTVDEETYKKTLESYQEKLAEINKDLLMEKYKR
ncbi:MAG: hypothetical protein ABIJ34_02685 [archaeon]